MLKENMIKVISGLFANLILMYFIQDLNFVVISFVQTAFFIVFYTLIDYIIKKVKLYYNLR